MTPPKSKNQAPAPKTVESEVIDLQDQLQVLVQDPATGDDDDDQERLHQKLESAHRIRQALIENTGESHGRDGFRRLKGFEAVIAVVRQITLHYDSGFQSRQDVYLIHINLFKAIFGVLAAALQDHKGNQKYFRQGVDGGGWLLLKELFHEMLHCKIISDNYRFKDLVGRVFGCLLACAVNDEAVSDCFVSLRRKLETSPVEQSQLHEENASPTTYDGAEVPEREETGMTTSQRTLLEKEIPIQSLVSNPEAVLIMYDLWRYIGVNDDPVQKQSLHDVSMGLWVVPSIVNNLVTSSTRNLAAIHGSGILNLVLTTLLSSSTLEPYISYEVRELARNLLGIGVSSLEDAHFLFRHARSSPLIAELLLNSIKKSRSPSFIHFDLSLNGFASIELPGIGRPFPPVSSSPGYTLSIWLQVMHFDPDAHTTIFGAFDASQTCFVLLYLEKDTHNLILQTSISSSRPSVRFKSISFEERRWYHVVITHRRPKTTTSARASLFVNGQFAEQVKSHYPSAPPTVSSNATSTLSPSSNRKSGAVQAFLGTPQDLATKLGRGLVFTQWRLASVTLFADILSDDLIAVYYELGPRYNGNYQDCLGSFQTYKASAALNLRNESLHPGKERSDIVSAVRSKAGILLRETDILLNLSANLVLDDDDRNSINEGHLLNFISKPAGRNLRNVTRGGRNALAVNGAIPSINEALLHSSGYAVLTGEPVVVVPQSLDDAAWRIGGCVGVGLALLDASQSLDETLRALEILLESVQENWRNSEAIERENGFGILSTLLTAKLNQQVTSPNRTLETHKEGTDDHQTASPLAVKALQLILNFVGYCIKKPEDSVINNPLAFRVLLVDMDYWRLADPGVQRLYYEQFTVFGVRSRFHAFNVKRLSKMRITRKWLDALKGELFTGGSLESFVEAFRVILTRNLSADSMRSLALYITYAIHKPWQKASFSSRSKSVKLKTDMPSRRRTFGSSLHDSTTQQHEQSPQFTQTQIALRILEMYAGCLCQGNDFTNIHKFAKTVTNKWLLHLLADDEPAVVVLATKILARLLIANGTDYMEKFVEKSGGMVVLQHRLKRWWNIPTIWPICFAILFGFDVGVMDFNRSFDLYNLLEMFSSGNEITIACPMIIPVIIGMLEEGLRVVTRDQSDPDSPYNERSNARTTNSNADSSSSATSRQRSMAFVVDNLATSKSLGAGFTFQGQSLTAAVSTKSSMDQLEESFSTLKIVTRFLADIQEKSTAFRDFTATSSYVQELLFVLFPIVVSANPVTPETELHARDSALTFKGGDVIMRPLSANSTKDISIVRTTTVESSMNLKPSKAAAPKRMSSYILVTSDLSQQPPTPSRLQAAITPTKPETVFKQSSSIVEELLELTIGVFTDQIFCRKDFPGLGLFMRVPPGFQEHQAYFETFILRNTLTHAGNAIKLDQKLLLEPRVLTNIARFATHLGEAVCEGWFIDGASDTLEFLAVVLGYLQIPIVASTKAVRLCSQIISNIRAILFRVLLLRLSELDERAETGELLTFLNKLVSWQTAILPALSPPEDSLKLLCYLVYNRLISTNKDVQIAAANVWRMLLVQEEAGFTKVLESAQGPYNAYLHKGLKKILELENETFLDWIGEHREQLDDRFFSALSSSWDAYVLEENRKTEETAKARINKRREKLKVWASEHHSKHDTLRRHEISTEHWRSNIFAAEQLKRQRALQDRQDSQAFNMATWAKMNRDLRRTCGAFDDTAYPKWQLDQTEGRNRMRMRLIPDTDAHLHDYHPKRSQSQGHVKRRRSTGFRTRPSAHDLPPLPNQATLLAKPAIDKNRSPKKGSSSLEKPYSDDENEDDGQAEDDFEIIDSPPDDNADEYEDKNRKVMRSLQRGDQVEHVHNVSRVIGLEAIEGLLILGQGHLYLLDNLFQRSDGEVVNVWQAPADERDSYLQMIAGKEARDRPTSNVKVGHERRCWRWDDVLSISKRRFLFRDVALEVFFVDGRSYLLTMSTPLLRDELCQRLLNKASHATVSALNSTGEDSWRMDAVRNPGEVAQTFGSRFTNVFAQHNSNPATRRWLKGEISNFHYLMLINTLAGRTFNDLTQYPVFPWVLADYTSQELDLTNPRTYRDLSKPMGCQNLERQAEFRERYQSFAEMGDEKSPAFHYGTHYSSAMIVTSYLIRVQPFVHSYLLLQGGNFDHPDRLFYSLEKAWLSASKDNMTDVRELIPEFFYLPEFLKNHNGYDFGLRQGDGGAIDTVQLPPWAKGDPKIFIAKHREALESDYVSQHLHQWIDLVFGHKQRGEAALEATNIFHHLSYHGAKDLDTIDDPVERLATIGIIHNFGQTPHQMFHRPHPPKEDMKFKMKRLDIAVESLTRLPFPLMETNDRVAHLQWSLKHDRLICSGPFRLNIGPMFDKYMEWGFIDGSVRFFSMETKKPLGLFEHVHQGQLSYVNFADSKTLLTAGSDCTISLWTVIVTTNAVDLQPKACLFGHRAAITVLAISRSFSALLSASSDGQVLLWDLNRLELVRPLTKGGVVDCARVNDVNGTIVLCRQSEVSLWTLNGDRILEQTVCAEGEDAISSCAFFEGSGTDYLERNLLFTGHKKGVVNVWSIAIVGEAFVLEHVMNMHHLDHAGYNIGATITSILPMALKVYTGDDDGRVYEWDCVQRQ